MMAPLKSKTVTANTFEEDSYSVVELEEDEDDNNCDQHQQEQEHDVDQQMNLILEEYEVDLEKEVQRGDNNINNNNQQQQYDEDDSKVQHIEELWNHATHFLRPTRMFKWAIYFYSERKLICLFWLHSIATIMIWFHYSLIRYQDKLQEEWEEDNNNNDEEAISIRSRIIFPAIGFGCKHAILFQLMLLPLTMSKHTIANLENSSFLTKLIPFHKTLLMHLYIGYLAAILVVLALIYFLIYYGILCSMGNQDYCYGLYSEIMITGYVIVGLLVLLYTTSYFRHSMPYEIFYYVHQTTLFLVYFTMIIHTIDKQYRSSNSVERYQTWPWLIFTFGFYLMDRITMICNSKYVCKIQEFHLVEGSIQNSKMIILKLTKPTLMKFQPGQYAFLQLPSISKYQWHPFTIASQPASSTIDFYIEVFDNKPRRKQQHSWTKDLWSILEHKQRRAIGMSISLMGPYGVSLVGSGNESNYSHVLAVGAGTGLVPCLSLFKQHVSNLSRLNPSQYISDMYERRDDMYQIALAKEAMKSSLGQKAFMMSSSCSRRQQTQKSSSSNNKATNRRRLVGLERTKSTMISDEISRELNGIASSASASGSCCSIAGGSSVGGGGGGGGRSVASSNDDNDINDVHNNRNYHLPFTMTTTTSNNNNNHYLLNRRLKIAVTKANKYLYGRVILCGILILGFASFMVGISFNTIPLILGLYNWMMPIFYGLTISFQVCFGVVSIFCWNASDDGILSFIDLSITLANPFVDWYFYNVIQMDETLQPTDLLWYSVITLYMIGRVWLKCVSQSSLYDYLTNSSNTSSNHGGNWDKFHLVWTTRSVGLVADILPDIMESWDGLVAKWGLDNVRKLCEITIYITDPSPEACELLQKEIQNTTLYKLGCFKFQRPNFEEIIKRHSIETMSTCRDSTTLLGFCGSPMLASKLFETKIANDIVIATTGQRSKHKMNFVCESFGGIKSGKKARGNTTTTTRVGSTDNKKKEQRQGPDNENNDHHDADGKREQAVASFPKVDVACSTTIGMGRPTLSKRHSVRKR